MAAWWEGVVCGGEGRGFETFCEGSLVGGGRVWGILKSLGGGGGLECGRLDGVVAAVGMEMMLGGIVGVRSMGGGARSAGTGVVGLSFCGWLDIAFGELWHVGMIGSRSPSPTLLTVRMVGSGQCLRGPHLMAESHLLLSSILGIICIVACSTVGFVSCLRPCSRRTCSRSRSLHPSPAFLPLSTWFFSVWC